MAPWSANSRGGGFARDVTFRAPIRGMSLGPKSTFCHQTQQLRRHAPGAFMLQSSQVMTDIPYGDYFRVEMRWDAAELPAERGGGCSLTVGMHVPFSKSTVWQGTIEKSTLAGAPADRPPQPAAGQPRARRNRPRRPHARVQRRPTP